MEPVVFLECGGDFQGEVSVPQGAQVVNRLVDFQAAPDKQPAADDGDSGGGSDGAVTEPVTARALF